MMNCFCHLLVMFLVLNLTSGEEIMLKAEAYHEYENTFEIDGALNITTAQTLIRCVRACAANDKCLTFFFNSNLSRCVMHSKHFYYQPPSMAEDGWKYYITKDITGKCPSPYLYYRNRGYCYTIEKTASIDFLNMTLWCAQRGGKLALVDSQAKYDIFVEIVGDRPDLRVQVPIQGKKVNGMWYLDDARPLTYFNWCLSTNQPSNLSDENCLAI